MTGVVWCDVAFPKEAKTNHDEWQWEMAVAAVKWHGGRIMLIDHWTNGKVNLDCCFAGEGGADQFLAWLDDWFRHVEEARA